MMSFRFESLDVWPLALEYVDACFTLADKFPQRVQFSIGEQLHRAATSIVANIAEGTGKSTQKSEANFYDIARGSVAETVSLLILGHRRGHVSDDHLRRMMDRANRISAMLQGLIRTNRLSEATEPYTTNEDSLAPIFASAPPASPDLSKDPAPWTTRETSVAFKNRWLSVEIDTVALPNGGGYEYTRLVPSAPGVGVFGFNPAGEILLEREYRHGVGEVIWQIPGGLADGAEDLQAAGLRELREETGFAPAQVDDATVRFLGCVWDNPAFGPMRSYLYAAWDLEPTSTVKRDPEEFVTLHWVSPAWLKEAVRNGEIKDRVVVAGVGYLLLNGCI